MAAAHAELGVNALYLGPLFKSTAHGYDTADYYQVDRRLGDTAALAHLSGELHQSGMRLMLDGVFNHVGRDFWAFRDVQQNGENSPYRDWFPGLRFDGRSPYGDPFTYEGWNGHYDLVQVQPAQPGCARAPVRGGPDLGGANSTSTACAWTRPTAWIWISCGTCASFCRGLRPDFWLMGEVVHGDYRSWANPQMLDSVTNYECYKGLYSSLAEKNYFEIAYALNRQFGEGGHLPRYAAL